MSYYEKLQHRYFWAHIQHVLVDHSQKYVHGFLFQINPLFSFILKESISGNFPEKVCFLSQDIIGFRF